MVYTSWCIPEMYLKNLRVFKYFCTVRLKSIWCVKNFPLFYMGLSGRVQMIGLGSSKTKYDRSNKYLFRIINLIVGWIRGFKMPHKNLYVATPNDEWYYSYALTIFFWIFFCVYRKFQEKYWIFLKNPVVHFWQNFLFFTLPEISKFSMNCITFQILSEISRKLHHFSNFTKNFDSIVFLWKNTYQEFINVLLEIWHVTENFVLATPNNVNWQVGN